jgi:hypothetical protein
VPDPGHDAVIDADHCCLPLRVIDNPDERHVSDRPATLQPLSRGKFQ